jgi:CheY-like chemotaxis protein
VQRSIKNAGMDVSFAEAETCAAAMQILERQDFDCIFVDYQLPDRDGLSLIRSIWQLNIKAPIVSNSKSPQEDSCVHRGLRV